MKTARLLLRLGGIANALFVLFHLLLGWRLHQLPLAPGLRATMEMLNGGGALYLVFLAYVSLAHSQEVLSSRLGTAVLALGSGVYLLRAVAEFIVPPQPMPAIAATCLLTGGLYAGAWFLARQPQSRPA